MRIVYEGGSAEIVEKKSRFIATVRPVHSEEEAAAFIAQMKKEYWDARHNCYAFVIGPNSQLMRFSDDGEPQGTGGKPVLSVLLSEDLHDACIVVTRYFGGILLGTGPLARAYGRAAAEGVKASRIADRADGFSVRIRTDYNGVGKVQYIFSKNEIPVTDSVYADNVEMEFVVKDSGLDAVRKELVEKTGGKIEFLNEKKISYAVIDGQLHLFDDLENKA